MIVETCILEESTTSDGQKKSTREEERLVEQLKDHMRVIKRGVNACSENHKYVISPLEQREQHLYSAAYMPDMPGS